MHFKFRIILFLVIIYSDVLLSIAWSDNRTDFTHSEPLSRLVRGDPNEDRKNFISKTGRLPAVTPTVKPLRTCTGVLAEQDGRIHPTWENRTSHPYIRRKGKIQSLYERQCLYGPLRPKNVLPVVSITHCTGIVGNQYWTFTERGKIRQNYLCLEYFNDKYVLLNKCKNDEKISQHWYYDPQSNLIHHIGSGKCLAVIRDGLLLTVVMEDCCANYKDKRLQWNIAKKA